MTDTTPWEQAQEHEAGYWRTVETGVGESHKQAIHAKLMNLPEFDSNQLDGKRILDVGGGPLSMTLRYPGIKRVNVDPMPLPDWAPGVIASFDREIEIIQEKAEDYLEEVKFGQFDEVWMYNCLQHTEHPQTIADGLANAAPVIRVFEWCDIPTDKCHLHVLTPALFRRYTPRQFWRRHLWLEGHRSDVHDNDAKFISFHVSAL